MAFNPDAHLPTSGFNPDNFLPKDADYQGVAGNLQSPAWVDQFNKLYDAGRFDEAKALKDQYGAIPFQPADDSAQHSKLYNAVFNQKKPANIKAGSWQDKLWNAADWSSQQPANATTGLAKGAVNVATAIPDYVNQPNQDLEKLIDPNVQTIHQKRMAQVDKAAQQFTNADPNSITYKAGKFAGDIAGTGGTGSILAKGLLRVAPSAVPLAEALSSGGMSAGKLKGAAGLGTRVLGGAINGGVSSAMVDPNSATTGFLIGGALPGAGYIPRLLSDASRKLMWSALKPTLAQQRTGQADQAIDTLLKYGINPTSGGVEKMRGMIGNLNDDIAEKITNSTAKIDKQDILSGLNEVRGKFGNQVAPTSDLNAIENVGQDFLSHPNIPTNEIPVQLAQKLKQGTYKTLSGKFGEVGSASTEAQKALARALKEKIAVSVPEVSALNAAESELINASNVAERRALMDMNKNPVGIAGLAHNPASWAMMMADKSALAKSLLSRSANSASKAANYIGEALPQPITNTALSIPWLESGLTDQQRLAMALMTDQQKQDYLKKLGIQ